MVSLETVVFRFLLAAVFGGIIGFQRERKERPAGFRTHILVALGSTLFTLVSMIKFNQPSDPSRIAAQIVTGIGFLGAGTIIRQGNIVIGLTTAASLWSVAAVGMAVGAGYYSAATVGTLMIFFALSFFKLLELRVMAKREGLLSVTFKPEIGRLPEIFALLKNKKVEISGFEVRQEANLAVANLRIKLPPKVNFAEITEPLLAVDFIVKASAQELPEIVPLFGAE